MSFLYGLIWYVLEKLSALFIKKVEEVEKERAEHQAAVDQAVQDNAKAQEINEKSKSDEVDAAIDDSLKHI